MTTPESKIIIVGAGVLGLSTALHLVRDGGYKDVTVFDRCDYATRHYDPAKGCDGASSDINKIFRADYIRSQGQYVHFGLHEVFGTNDNFSYGKMALESRDVWLEWNEQIKKTPANELPAPLTPDDKLFDVCGLYHLSDGKQLFSRYQQYLDSMLEVQPSNRERQFVKGRAGEEERLQRLCPSFAKKYHLFDNDSGGNLNGYLSTTDGVLLADKACWTHLIKLPC